MVSPLIANSESLFILISWFLGAVFAAYRIATSSPIWFDCFLPGTHITMFCGLWAPYHTPLPALASSVLLLTHELSVYIRSSVLRWVLFIGSSNIDTFRRFSWSVNILIDSFRFLSSLVIIMVIPSLRFSPVVVGILLFLFSWVLWSSGLHLRARASSSFLAVLRHLFGCVHLCNKAFMHSKHVQ